jgi:hypothetical protein
MIRLWKSWRESPDTPAGWLPAKPPNAVVKVRVKNAELMRILRDQLPGAWYKVYRKGRDGTELHYFEHVSGMVAV